jgi:hypothetical protein
MENILIHHCIVNNIMAQTRIFIENKGYITKYIKTISTGLYSYLSN